MHESTIRLQGNGYLVIHDSQNGALTLNTNDPADMAQKMPRLTNPQLAVLKQMAEEQGARLGETFKLLLGGMVAQKNLVHGPISNVKSVRIGDELHYHYHPAPARFPKALSAKVPRTNPDKIIGRDDDLADLHGRLCDQRQVVVVNGLGGIGKTTLAQGYVAKYWDAYHHVAWISQTSDNIIDDFVNTEGLLNRLHISADGKEARVLFAAVMNALQTMADHPNLLIVDNAESTLSELHAYLPAQPQWHVLVTSRQQIPNFDVKELGFLSEREAIELFLSHYSRGDSTREAIKELVRAVDLHTLTIEILAKTAQTQRTPIQQLKRAITDDARANVYIAHKGQKVEKVTSYLCSIFTLSRLTDNELWLLAQFSCLPPEFHGYDLLREIVDPAATQKEEIFSETLEALTDAGWLLENQATDSYKMHRIIAEVIKRQYPIAPTDVAPLLARVTEKLRIDQSKDNPVDRFPWVPFGNALLDTFPDSDLPDIATLQNNLATVLKDLGDYAGAKTLLQQALRSDEKNFGPDHPTTAVSYSNLATVLKDLGDYAEALRFSEKALRVFQEALPQGHPTIQVVSDIYQSIQQQIQ